VSIPRAAPHVDARLIAGLAKLDKAGRPIADTHRLVGVLADELGLTRPSYEQARTIVHLLRSARRDPELGQVLLDVTTRVRPPEALVDDPQLNARGFFSDIRHPEIGQNVRYPGGPFRFTVTPWRIARRPPLLGEHNADVYQGELEMSATRMTQLVRDRII